MRYLSRIRLMAALPCAFPWCVRRLTSNDRGKTRQNQILQARRAGQCTPSLLPSGVARTAPGRKCQKNGGAVDKNCGNPNLDVVRKGASHDFSRRGPKGASRRKPPGSRYCWRRLRYPATREKSMESGSKSPLTASWVYTSRRTASLRSSPKGMDGRSRPNAPVFWCPSLWAR